ncbi:MAG: phosphomannomutase/phosphoglucomutase [Christensenellaceae bacterium]|nr:phosphomannomutase/phosphoglucomutase [Christensenellaceae bacterium]
MSEYLGLLSGSDIRGTAIDLGAGVDLTPEIAAMAAAAFARRLKAGGCANPAVALGRDPRLSGPALLEGAARGLLSEGAAVLDLGLSTTPALFMATQDLSADGSIMVTASHLPYERNGLKFITKGGGLPSSAVKALLCDLRPLQQGKIDENQRKTVAFLPLYAQGLLDYIRAETGEAQPLRGRRIVLDAGNGSGGFFAESVLKPLGADITGSVNLRPDGSFPAHSPNPEDGAAMAAAGRAVLEARADLGVIFDADCDRAALIGPDGAPVNRNRLVALVAAAELQRNPGAAIVTDSVTSLGLTAFIESLGGVHRRFKRGYNNVIGEARRLNESGVNCPMAMETSGHCAFRDHFFLDDGAFMVCRALAALNGRRPMDLISGLQEPLEEGEFRLRLKNADFRADGQAAIGLLRAAIGRGEFLPDEDFEGVRALDGQGGYILLRLSLHDPVLPVNLESAQKGGLNRLKARLFDLLRPLEGAIGLEPLSKE